MKNKIKVVLLAGAMFAVIAMPLIAVHADAPVDPCAGLTGKPLEDCKATPATGGLPHAPQGFPSVTAFVGFVNTIIDIFFWALIFISIIYILIAAFDYLTAGGDPEKVEKANRSLLYAAIAIAVAVVAKGVPFVICRVAGGANASAACQAGQNFFNQPY